MTEQSSYTLQTTLDGVGPAQLTGFFVGWPNPPSPETFHRLLAGSYRFVLAVQNGQVIGFVQAVSDGVLTAFIPLLEVLPSHQSQGIGRALMERMLTELGDLYAVDLACDDDLVPFYEGLGLRQANLMFRRNYAGRQARGKAPTSTAAGRHPGSSPGASGSCLREGSAQLGRQRPAGH